MNKESAIIKIAKQRVIANNLKKNIKWIIKIISVIQKKAEKEETQIRCNIENK